MCGIMYTWAVPVLISFLLTYVLLAPWIKNARKIGLVGKDMNKHEKPEVAEMGGILTATGFVTGALVYSLLAVFVMKETTALVPIIATIATVLLCTLIGFVDDILGWKIGLRQWQKPLLTVLAAVPVVLATYSITTMRVPFFDEIEFGLLYPLAIIPLGIVGASNAFNIIAGYNGLEAGVGAIILSVAGIIAISNGVVWLGVFAFCMVAALLAFIRFNWYPAKIFPGDTLTYSVGALIACVAIFGRMEVAAAFLLLPHFFDFILNMRGRFAREAFSKPQKDNALEPLYETNYKVSHVILRVLKKMKQKVYEKDIVYAFLLIEAVLGAIVLYVVLIK